MLFFLAPAMVDRFIVLDGPATTLHFLHMVRPPAILPEPHRVSDTHARTVGPALWVDRLTVTVGRFTD